MEMQFDLFGAPRPQERGFPLHRSYFALLPPPKLAQRVEAYAKRLARAHAVRRVTQAQRLHISLANIRNGDAMAPDELEEALAIGDAIRVPPFDLHFDRLETWDGGHPRRGRRPVPTVLACSAPPREAGLLYSTLDRQMRHFERRTSRQRFNPHMSLWYAPTPIAPRALSRPLLLRVDRFWLVHTMAGGQLEAIASWPLKF